MNDTLAYHSNRPFRRYLDLSGVSLKSITKQWSDVKEMLQTEDGCTKQIPEQDAIWFYMTNNAMDHVRRQLEEDEPLGEFEKYVNSYHEMMQVKSIRMFYYLLMITTRESRHNHEGTRLQKLWSKYPKIEAYHKSILQSSEMNAVQKLVSSPPEVPLGEYTQWLVDQFNHGKYGHSYGGKAWGQVASCLNEFVWGRASAELMMDTAFTLSHNTGPIFNKGMLYELSSKHEILKILDVQNSGQIPQLVAESNNGYVTPAMSKYHNEFEKLVPAFGGHIDWFKVEALGAKGSYPHEKSTQMSKHGKPQEIELSEKIQAMKVKADKLKKVKEHEVFLKTHLEIMPEVFVKTVAREA